MSLRKILPLVAIVAAFLALRYAGPLLRDAPAGDVESSELARAIQERSSNLHVSGEGRVRRVLPDDTHGDRHQRFILQVESGQTVLITHNIDLAPRIPALEEGDRIEFRGIYEWTPQGGVVHWTHHDPHGTHPAGWLKHNGELYQ